MNKVLKDLEDIKSYAQQDKHISTAVSEVKERFRDMDGKMEELKDCLEQLRAKEKERFREYIRIFSTLLLSPDRNSLIIKEKMG